MTTPASRSRRHFAVAVLAGALVGVGLGVLASGDPGSVLVDFRGGNGFGVQGSLLPRTAVQVPGTSEGISFVVKWSSPADGALEPDHFRVQVSESGAAAWRDWILAMPVAEGSEATFTGEPGAAYTFRARACPVEGDCGDWTAPVATQVAPGIPDSNRKPQVALLQPENGRTLSGERSLFWDALDGMSDPPIVNLEVRLLEATQWTALYSGYLRGYTWDTTQVPDGIYTIRATATDGTLASEDTARVIVDNEGSGPDLNGEEGQRYEAPGAGIGLMLGVVGVALAAGVRRRA